MSVPERILFGLYVLVGPLAWLLVAYFVKVGRSRMSKLTKSRDVLQPDPPLVSILIPAKDEGPAIGDCLQRVLRQTYPNTQVIAINDRSADDTGAVIDEYATPSPEFAAITPVHVTHLPEGWLGKCHALDQAARHARGEWLFFVDSDVRLDQDALTRMAATAIAREYDALSILTRIDARTFVERLMLPLLAATWMTMFAGDQTNEDSEKTKALANGQVFLIRAAAYRQVGGHAAVKDRIVEDVELMRLLKANDFKCRLMTAPELASTRMHTHLAQMFNGWARIYAGTARGRVWPMLAAMAFWVVCGLTVWPAWIYGFAAHSSSWLLAATAHVCLMSILAAFVWRWSGNPPWEAICLPVSVPIQIAILAYAVRKAISGKIDWRGSAVNLRQTSRTREPTA